MAHFFSNRRRSHGFLAATADSRVHFRWETLNALVYTLGGAIFVVGSVLFFPGLEAWEDIGAGAFLAGSLLYLLVTGHDLLEVVVDQRRAMLQSAVWRGIELSAAVFYFAGTVLFVGGSVCFFSAVDMVPAGAWSFLVGSLLFVFGAVANILQIVMAATLKTMQLLNLTAVSFVVGSVLFAVASVPFLWDVAASADRRQIDAYLAWLFVVGSLLFLIGGLFNYWRAWLVVHGDGGR